MAAPWLDLNLGGGVSEWSLRWGGGSLCAFGGGGNDTGCCSILPPPWGLHPCPAVEFLGGSMGGS